MALYRVEIINDDGEDDWVEVEATSIGEARTKAAAMPQTESVTGTPALQRGPTRAARPNIGAGDAGEEQGGAGRSFQFVQPGGGTGDTGFIRLPLPGDPQTAPMPVPETGDFLGDTGFIRLPGIGAPPKTTTFRDFTQTIDPLINPDLFDPNAPITPPGTGAFGAVPTAPPTVIDPGGLVSRGGTLLRGGGFGPTGFADENIVPNIVPPVVLPPAVSGFAGDDNFAANIVPTPRTVAPPAVSGFADDVPFVAPVAPLPPATVGPAAVNGAGNGVVNGAGTGFADDDSFAANVGPVVGAGNGGPGGNGEVVINPATGLPVLTSQELINDPYGYTREAGRRLALRNVFGQQALGQGPLAGYLQRQLDPLQSAFRAEAFADMARAFAQDQPLALAGQGGTAQGPPQYPYASPALAGGGTTVDDLGGTSLQDFQAAQAAAEVGGTAAPTTGVAAMPGYSFEDFLRTTRGQDTGLGGAYGQALQNVGYLRGLGQGAVPPALAGIFDPEQAAGTRDVWSLLGAAQRGRYSGLVSSAFRRPSEDDLFADYVLARQDATAAGQAPQNFLNFAASRYGL